MVIIAPSLLSCDFLNIEKEIKVFEGVKDFWFHLDIMDGHFVPNLTFGHPIVSMVAKKTTQKLDAHFMVTNPDFYIETFKDFNIHNFTFHVESCNNVLQLISKAKKYYPSIGLSLKPSTPLSAISDEMFKGIDLLLVMSVEPGFSGQSFHESTYDRLKAIAQIQKRLDTHFMVQVDGGVSDKNAKKLIDLGANNLVSGSYIFKHGPSKFLEMVESLR